MTIQQNANLLEKEKLKSSRVNILPHPHPDAQKNPFDQELEYYMGM